jgi:nicotinamide riboside kinase
MQECSQCCATQLHAFKRSIVEVSNRQYRKRKSKTIDVAELYFKVKDFLEDFDPNNRADLHR